MFFTIYSVLSSKIHHLQLVARLVSSSPLCQTCNGGNALLGYRFWTIKLLIVMFFNGKLQVGKFNITGLQVSFQSFYYCGS